MCVDMYSEATRSIEGLIASLTGIFPVILARNVIVFSVRYQNELAVRQ